jgi:hypothetical protein
MPVSTRTCEATLRSARLRERRRKNRAHSSKTKSSTNAIPINTGTSCKNAGRRNPPPPPDGGTGSWSSDDCAKSFMTMTCGLPDRARPRTNPSC